MCFMDWTALTPNPPAQWMFIPLDRRGFLKDSSLCRILMGLSISYYTSFFSISDLSPHEMEQSDLSLLICHVMRPLAEEGARSQ